MTAGAQPLEDRVDALFRLPPDEFVGARNALAGELRKAKSVDAAERVKALVKPSASAWVVNQLFWAYRDDFDRLLAAGARARAAQQAGFLGRGKTVGLPEAARERRAAVAGLLRQAQLVLAGGNRVATPALLRRVETTLEATAAFGGGGPDARLGRFVRDLDPPGFEALLELASQAVGTLPGQVPAPRPPPSVPAQRQVPLAPPAAPPPAVPPKAERRAQERARAAVMAALEELERFRLAAGEEEAARAAAAARNRQAVAEVAHAKRQLARAENHAARAAVALQRAETRKHAADADVERAGAALAAARAAAAKNS